MCHQEVRQRFFLRLAQGQLSRLEAHWLVHNLGLLMLHSFDGKCQQLSLSSYLT